MYSPDIDIMLLHITVTFGSMPYNNDGTIILQSIHIRCDDYIQESFNKNSFRFTTCKETNNHHQ